MQRHKSMEGSRADSSAGIVLWVYSLEERKVEDDDNVSYVLLVCL